MAFCHLSSIKRFEDFRFPALEWWVPADEPYFVVLSESWQSRFNQLLETDDNFTRFYSRIYPVFVKCSRGRDPECVCCKQHEGMLYMIKNFDYDWLVYHDDDNFVRSSYMRAFLANISTKQLLVMTSGPAPRLLGKFGYLSRRRTHSKCTKDQFGYLSRRRTPYKCTKDWNYSFPWGQMVAYNRRTLHTSDAGWN
jgi:hypothetical protein